MRIYKDKDGNDCAVERAMSDDCSISLVRVVKFADGREVFLQCARCNFAKTVFVEAVRWKLAFNCVATRPDGKINSTGSMKQIIVKVDLIDGTVTV